MTNKLLSSFFVIALLYSAVFTATGKNVSGNASERKAYLEKMLKEICTDIGPHSIFDTTAFKKAANIVKREMADKGLVIVSNEYTFKGWSLLEKPTFTINDTIIKIAVCHGSCSTPTDGVKGTAQRIEFKNPDKVLYTLTDSHGKVCLHIIPHGPSGATAAPMPFYSAIPLVDSSVNEFPYIFDKESKVPAVMIGNVDIPRLEKAIQEKTEVYCNVKTKYIPGMKSESIAGTIKGKKKDEILLIGHLDTVYDSPGANDNTATILMLMMLAFARVNTVPDMTITVLATSGEEYGKLGAWSYFKKREKEGTLKDIKYALNFDSMTWGDEKLLLNSTNETLLNLIAKAQKSTGLHFTIDNIRKDFYLDATPFFKAGIPSLNVNTRGLPLNEIYRIYHHPEDVASTVNSAFVEKWFTQFNQVLNDITQ